MHNTERVLRGLEHAECSKSILKKSLGLSSGELAQALLQLVNDRKIERVQLRYRIRKENSHVEDPR